MTPVALKRIDWPAKKRPKQLNAERNVANVSGACSRRSSSKTEDRSEKSSYVDSADEEARRARHEERRMRRSVDVTAGDSNDRPRASRRRSDYPAPVDGYFDRRHGEQTHANGGRTPLADGRLKASSSGNDKTASWVNSVNEDPPPPPPVEGTILDAPAHHVEDTVADNLDETTAREMRKNRRKDRDAYVDDDSERRRRRRETRHEDGQRSSDGSGHDRRRSYAAPSNSMGYGDMGGVKTWDGRPALAPKRNSLFKKLTGF